MLRANKDFHDTKSSITRLWIHECFRCNACAPLPAPARCPSVSPGLSPLPPCRVFSDRLVDATDMEAFMAIISDKLGSFFDLTFHNLCPSRRSPIFGELVPWGQSWGHGGGEG